MPYTQNIEHCFAEAGVAGGIARAAYDARFARLDAGLDQLRAQYTDGSLPLLRLPERRDDLAECREVASDIFASATDIVVLGIGGSSLGAQALAQLRGFGTPEMTFSENAPRIHFPDNLDAQTMGALLNGLNLRSTGFLVVSKSGGTAETLLQTLTFIEAVREAGSDVAGSFVGITEPGDNPLRHLAEREGFRVLDHDPDIGGRYTVLSNVGLLPALLMGMDVEAIRAGAAKVLAPIVEGARAADYAPAQGAALSVALAEDSQATTTVLMPYSNRLERFAMWYRQLWGESLGKDNKGTTPIASLMPVDQHSQLQLYLNGPRDKMFTVLMADNAGQGPRAPATTADERLGYLAGRTIGDLVDAEQRATVETLIRNGCPVRTINIPSLDEETMGALLMHFMMETILAGYLFGVNPFDQPAVEEGKVLARKYLGQMT